MSRRTQRATLTATLFPYPSLCRSTSASPLPTVRRGAFEDFRRNRPYAPGVPISSASPFRHEGSMNTGKEEKIRQRAYEIWQREGRPSGRDQDHWSQAQAEITREEREGNLGATGAMGGDRDRKSTRLNSRN